MLLIFLISFHLPSLFAHDVFKRMVGGDELIIDTAVPFMVRIAYKDPDYPTGKLCGGSLITKRTVLTSSVCFPKGTDTDTSSYKLYVGSNSWSGTKYEIDKIVFYPSITPSVVLIISNQDIVIGPSVNSIEINPENVTDGEAIAYGFGVTKPGGFNYSPDLKKLKFHIKANEDCNIASNDVNMFTDLCGQGDSDGSICHGDEGGPLVQNNQLIGVISKLFSECDPSKPNVFVRISLIDDWIQKNKID